MSSSRNTEPQGNGELARVLRRRNPDWSADTLYAERTNVIRQATGKQPDIVAAASRRQPVILETEFAPAFTVEKDALARLGTHLQTTGEEVEGVLSVVLPERLKTADLETIEGATFRYATHYLNAKGKNTRWLGGREWHEGDVDDLADAVEHLSLSQRQLARGTEAMEKVVWNTVALLGEHAGKDALAKIASDLHQESGEQTQRMAAASFVSAFVFHAAIEEQKDIPPVPLGGTVWPNVVPHKQRYEIPLLVWCNSALGILMHRWRGTRQQAGRSRMKITDIPSLPVLDPRSLTGSQIDHSRAIFEDFNDREFLPANEVYRDETRKDLDHPLLFGITSVLKLETNLEKGLDHLRLQWCAEPSVHGGKSTRPGVDDDGSLFESQSQT